MNIEFYENVPNVVYIWNRGKGVLGMAVLAEKNIIIESKEEFFSVFLTSL